MMDFEVQRCSRVCTATGRELRPGEQMYSVLTVEGSEVVRQDYSAEGWAGPPENAWGWWSAPVPTGELKKTAWAPNDLMLNLFEEWEHQPDRQDFRYVLALLLIRRKVLRLEETEHDAAGNERLLLSCNQREAEYQVAVVPPDAARTAEIQAQVEQLFFAKDT